MYAVYAKKSKDVISQDVEETVSSSVSNVQKKKA